MSFFYTSAMKTIVAFVALVVIGLCVEFILLKKISKKRSRVKAKIFSRNILFIVFLFFLTKIWIDGFGHLLAVVGFVSAALTITQKENILNVTGWLIIMWRDAFSEGDFVAIQQHKGIVTSIGVFYFTLEEQGASHIQCQTGKVVKVPNSFVTLHPFVVHAHEDFLLYEKTYVFTFSSSIKKIEEFKVNIESSAKVFLEQLIASFDKEELAQYEWFVRRKKFCFPTLEWSIEQNGIKGIQARFLCHCLRKHRRALSDFIDMSVITFNQKSKDISLVEG